MDRLIRAVSVSVVLFFVVLGLVIGSRMDQNTIALLGGTTIGLLIATPCAAIVTYLVIRNRDESAVARPPSPPTYYVVPQVGPPNQLTPPNCQHPLPGASPAFQQSIAPLVPPPQRRFYVIGGGTTSEVMPEGESDQLTGGHAPWQNVQ
jgi:hypothetical protein